jgi:hypothetical protein
VMCLLVRIRDIGCGNWMESDSTSIGIAWLGGLHSSI